VQVTYDNMAHVQGMIDN